MRRLLRRRRAADEDVSPDEYALQDEVLPGETDSFDAFVPVEHQFDEYEIDDEAETLPPDDADVETFTETFAEAPIADSAEAPEYRRRRLRRRPTVSVPALSMPTLSAPAVPVRPGVLLTLLILIAGGVFGTLLRQDRINDDVVAWWPLGIVALAVLWLLAALIQRRITSFLGAAACAGVGLAVLMETQDIAALEETMLGVVLITVGLGIVIRGFLLRQQVYET